MIGSAITTSVGTFDGTSVTKLVLGSPVLVDKKGDVDGTGAATMLELCVGIMDDGMKVVAVASSLLLLMGVVLPALLLPLGEELSGVVMVMPSIRATAPMDAAVAAIIAYFHFRETDSGSIL